MKNNIQKFKIYISNILIFCSLFDLIIFFSLENLVAVLLLNLSWLVSSKVLFKKSNIILYPMSTLMLIGYNLFFIILPLPATLIEFKPVIYNLKNPIETFANIFLLNLILLLFYLLYKNIFPSNKVKSLTRILFKFNFFRKFTNKEILLMSFISLFIVGLYILIVGRWSIEDDNEVGSKFYSITANFQPYLLLPILFLFPKFNLVKGTISNKYKNLSWFFLILIVIIGIASNIRTIIVSYASQIFISILFLYLVDKRKDFIKLKYLIFLILLPIFKDLSLAMVIVRSEKFDLSGVELIEKTINVYKDKELLDKTQKIITNSNMSNESWDERYLDNDLLNRFCSVKNIDETIYYAHKIGFANKKMQDDYYKKMIFLLPDKIVNYLGYTSQERQEINSYSESDYLFHLGSNEYGLGTFRIGSISGLGLSLFGYYYLLVAGFIVFLLFYVFDSTVIIHNNSIVFSVWNFLNLFYIFYILSAGHNYHTEVRFLIRGFLESVVFYFLFTSIIRIFFTFKIK